MRFRGFLIFTTTLAVLAALLGGMAYSILNESAIYPGVRVGATALGGLNRDQALKRAGEAASEITHRYVSLNYPSGCLNATAGDLGARIDVAACVDDALKVGRIGGITTRLSDILAARRDGVQIPLVRGFDKDAASHRLQTVAAKVNHPAVDATLVADNDTASARADRPGTKLNIKSSLLDIERAINSGQKEVSLSVETTKPEVTASDLSGIDGVLAQYSTRYKPGQRDRSHNLMIACRSIDGTIIKPGEIFSYNAAVGPRLKKFGFRDAPIFVNGEVQDGTGGGICQVCTTIYNAALLANMKIVRRSHHSMPVHYAPMGRDATVAWPSLDFKFENTSDTPVYISVSLKKSKVNATIFGKRSLGEKVEIFTSGHKVVPYKTVTVADLDPDNPHDKPHPGHRISVYRVVKVGETVTRQEVISNDFYKPLNKFVLHKSKQATGISASPTLDKPEKPKKL